MKHKDYYSTKGSTIRLTKELGKGGEGSVYSIDNHASQAAKIYKQLPSPQLSDKLRRMGEHQTKELLQFTSWPTDCLLDRPNGKTVGFLMPRVPGKAIHNLYTPKSRLKEFPKARWSFLILAARNLAACFESIHNHGHVVGDVNHGNAFINDDARVWLIDCDSFQIKLGGIEHRCTVGVDTHTPPELQSLQLKDVTRASNHDNFGLAVLIFQLLFMGRHPFSGRFLGTGDLTIAKAISEYRFAFGSGALGRLMETPPNTLPLEGASAGLAALFQSAFMRPNKPDSERPGPGAWIKHLDNLSRRLKGCSLQPSHEYYSGLSSCPWCSIEAKSGTQLFNQAGPSATSKTQNFQTPWEAICSVAAPPFNGKFPDPGPQKTSPSQKAKEMRDGSRGSLFSKLKAWMRLDSQVNAEVKLLKGELALVNKEIAALKEQWNSEGSDKNFTDKKKSLGEFNQRLLGLSQQLASELNKLKEKSYATALARHFEANSVSNAAIYGVGPVLRNTLIACGIRTAADVKKSHHSRIPGFGPAKWDSLTYWAHTVESKFRFDPNRDIDASAVRALDARFKNEGASLERILHIGVSELRSVATRIELARLRVTSSLQLPLSKRDQLLADISHLQRL